jgi:acetoin utilization deacetylase AcuC-like enzyme
VPERFDSILSAVREIDDPIGIFHLTTDGFNEIGRRIRTLNEPTLVVQEGGYCVPDLGRNVVTFLEGLANSS